LEKIGIVLLNSIKNSRFKKRLMEAKVFVDYESIVGRKISDISRPTSIKNGTLFIGVENHVWIHQLHFLKPDLIDRINANFPDPIIKDIKFVLCDISKNNEIDDEKSNKQSKTKQTVVPEKTMKIIYNVSQKIDDKELRNVFERIMVKDAQFKIKRGKNIVYPHRQ